MALQILPVSAVSAYVQQLVAADIVLSDIWIEGEITSITRAKSGHIYFKVSESNAVLDGVMWRGNATRQVFVPEAGETVVLHGHADFYPPQGRFQIQADVFERQGQGLLALEAERLRQRLEAEGMFDPSRKRPLPRFPVRVGVVTSSSGAVWHDIQTVARRRYPLIELMLAPASVQGGDAPRDIERALRRLSAVDDIDVIILARGGGSSEDLACFNDERVARAIFASHTPIVSAIGHETDVSIADMVADVRAPTPSAAAEIVLPDSRELHQQLDDFRAQSSRTVQRHLLTAATKVDSALGRIARQAPQRQISQGQRTLDTIHGRLQTLVRMGLDRREHVLESRSQLLHALHPRHVLQRGYAIVEDEETHTRITSSASLNDQQSIRVHFSDGVVSGSLTRRDV